MNGTTPSPHELTPDLLITYGAILTMAQLPIYIGSHLSLKYKVHGEDEDKEMMSAKDAWTFPLIGSVILFSLYLIFKVFDKDLINYILTSYFLFLGFFSLVRTFTPVFQSLLPSFFWANARSFTIPPIPLVLDKSKVVSCAIGDLFVWALCGVIIAAYVSTKNWIFNNLLGLSFSIQGVALFGLGSYKIGCILLSGLFFYDIFWVFGTDVMVTVAKSFDAPIKLLFPKSLWASQYQFSMLGLGDIVIPGVFIALLLRYDYHRYVAKTKSVNKKNHTLLSSFPKPYFYNTFIGYFVGLATTVFVMHTFQAAQPALLYLVPTCIGFSVGTSLYLGDFSQLLAYSEEEDESTENKEETKKKKQ